MSMHHIPDELVETTVQVSHPDNWFRFGTLQVWDSRQEGVGLEISFPSRPGQDDGEFVMAVTDRHTLEELHRGIGRVLELASEWEEHHEQ